MMEKDGSNSEVIGTEVWTLAIDKEWKAVQNAVFWREEKQGD